MRHNEVVRCIYLTFSINIARNAFNSEQYNKNAEIRGLNKHFDQNNVPNRIIWRVVLIKMLRKMFVLFLATHSFSI